MYYPRVVIVGETFRLNGGGGITLTNLFKDWPPENIGVVTNLIGLTNPLTGYSYYQLGMDEIKFPFPFHPFQTYFKSGPYEFVPGDDTSRSAEVKQSRLMKMKKKIRPAFDNFLHRAGLFSVFYRIRLSEPLKKWITDFNPDIFYIQAFYPNMMRFGNLLHDELNIPYAIHIMDDSVTYVNRSLFLIRKSNQRRVTSDFIKLVSNASVHLCISEAMAEEYSSRYGKHFLHFRNPIEVSKWLPNRKENTEFSSDCLRIIYIGRTYPPYFDTLVDTCSVIDRLNRRGVKVSLDISSIDINKSFLKRIKNFVGISFFSPVAANDFPQMISQFDIFLICEDFDREAQRYLHFSISTRASEGMISGVPVLIYAPKSSALCRYFGKTESGLIVGERDTAELMQAILRLRNDKEYRKFISGNAVRTAMEDSDSIIVREEFRKALTINKNGTVS